MKFILAIFLAVVPIVIYLIVLRWLDKYDREPLNLVIYHFLWGMIGAAFFTILLGLYVDHFIYEKISDEYIIVFLSGSFTAPVIEESVKGIFLIFTFTKLKFDNLTDGIVYGGSIGLGFGLTENFLYFILYTESIKELLDLALIRDVFSVGTHFAASSIFGSAILFSKFKSFKLKIIYFIMGLFLAVSIHSIFNQTIIFEETFYAALMFGIVIVLLIYFLLTVSLNLEENILFYEMNDEISLGNLKAEYASAIPYYKERNTQGWIKESIRKKYITLATTLAFRKNQLKKIPSLKMRLTYEKEIENLRDQLKQLEMSADE